MQKKFAEHTLASILLSMQAISRNSAIGLYNEGMPIGRPSTRKRTEFGQRLFVRREAAGLTQAEIARQLNLSQRAYAAWERDPVAIRPERLAHLAAVLGTSVSELLGEAKPRRKANVSNGRLAQSYDAISKLSRRQQAKILDVTEAMLVQIETQASAEASSS